MSSGRDAQNIFLFPKLGVGIAGLQLTERKFNIRIEIFQCASFGALGWEEWKSTSICIANHIWKLVEFTQHVKASTPDICDTVPR